jgi:hypothetical protein
MKEFNYATISRRRRLKIRWHVWRYASLSKRIDGAEKRADYHLTELVKLVEDAFSGTYE